MACHAAAPVSRTAVLLITLALACPWQVSAQQPSPTLAAAGPNWAELSASQRQALQPLQTHWSGIDPQRKQKWLDVAIRFPGLPEVQQKRLHERMLDWATMTPAQRNAARINFEELRKLPATERQTRWETYQNLSAEERQTLTAQASRRPAPASAPQAAAARKTPAIDSMQAKSNIVKAPQSSSPPQPIAPGKVLAGVGTSTRPISKPPTPPRHQQAGLPKIAATPEFVQADTLLPQRGPQGAAAGPLTRPDTP